MAGGGHVARRWSQIDPKSCQAGPSQPSASQIFPRENPWISLDSLVRIEPFQRVTLTPQGKKFFSLICRLTAIF
jgi:hypothetical protein